MDFRFSDKSKALQENLEDFFRSEILPRNREWHTHVGKHHCAVWTRTNAGKFNDFQSSQWAHDDPEFDAKAAISS